MIDRSRSTQAEIFANSCTYFEAPGMVVGAWCRAKRAEMCSQNASAKQKFMPAGYSFATAVLKLPSAALPMRGAVGRTNCGCSFAAKTRGIAACA